MDTRYWGPSGWKLLHSITFSYEDKLKNYYNDFFYVIAFLLPCKFCRKSYSEYILNDPINVKSKESFTKWLWRIHNKVNEKLRGQGLCKYEDPPFSEVKKFYEEKLNRGCSRVIFEGWEFLFSIVEAHPTSKLSIASKPFDISENIQINTPLLRNIYNVMEPNERLTYYKQFWKLVPKVLPFKEWRNLWSDKNQGWDTRAESLKNLYAIRCDLENKLELQNKTKFSYLCRELRSYKSGCNKSKRSKTCRSTTRKQKGGKKIGEGIGGIVYYPALECKKSSETPTGDYVSKKSLIKTALKEFDVSEMLRSLKPDNVIYPEYMCTYDDTHNVLFSKFGGYSLVNYYDYLETLAYSKKPIAADELDERYFSEVIQSLYELKDSVKQLNNNNIYQGDISFDNILYNEEKKKSYLIDFGRASKKNDESKEVQKLIDTLEEFKRMIKNR